MQSTLQHNLFDTPLALPEGFVYEPEFLTGREEQSLVVAIAGLPLEEAQYKQFTARRRTVSYGFQYDFSKNRLDAAAALPEFLMPLREKVAKWVSTPPESFVHGLVSEYQPGTPLGWHRDVRNFELIVGISLGGSCRMRLRPYRPGERNRREDVIALELPYRPGERNRREDVIALELAPRSAYVMHGPARWQWQHSVAPTKELRYSITFRTARAQTAA